MIVAKINAKQVKLMVSRVIERRMPRLLPIFSFFKMPLIFIFNDLFNSEFGGRTLRYLISISDALVSWRSLDRTFSVVINWLFPAVSLLTNVLLHVHYDRLIIILSSYLLWELLHPVSVIFRTFSACRFLLRNNSGRYYIWCAKCWILVISILSSCRSLVLECWVFFWDDRIGTILILLIIDLVDWGKRKIWVFLVFR